MSSAFLTQTILPIALFIIMYGMGLSLRISDFYAAFKSPKSIAVGLVGQMVLLPMLAFLIAIIFALPAELAVGLILVALAPGGVTSNMFTYLAKGDVALSISLTSIVSLLAPFCIPFFTLLSMDYFMGDGASFELPFLKTVIQLLAMTVIPVILGMATLVWWPKLSQLIEKYVKWFSIGFLVFVILLILLQNQDNIVDYFIQAGVAALSLNICALLLGFYLAKVFSLAESHQITISFEVGIQNGTLAIFVAGTIIGNQYMMIPALNYGLLMFFSGGAFCQWILRGKNKKALDSYS